MNIPQDVIGNRHRWDWVHRAVSSPRTPDDMSLLHKNVFPLLVNEQVEFLYLFAKQIKEN